MRLLHVFTVPVSLRFLRGQAAFMQSRGIEVHVACAPGPELVNSARELNVEGHAVQMSRRIAPVEDVRAVSDLLSLIRRLQPDIVHAHTPKGGMLGMIAARSAGVGARFYHMRGLPMVTATGLQRPLLAMTERLSCALASRVFTVSESMRQAAIESRLVAADRIRVLGYGSSNGVDAERRFDPDRIDRGVRTAVRDELGIAHDAPVIGFVGRLAVDKGVRELAEAFRLVRRHLPDAHLLLVGPTDERDPIASDLLIDDAHVHTVGMREDLPRLYSAMDVLVLPSYREGFPNVALEAAAMRLPVVTTDAIGCRDAVIDGVTGRVVPVRSVEPLAAAALDYLRNPEARRLAGEAGRRRTLERFRGEIVWEALHREYTEQVARAPS